MIENKVFDPVASSRPDTSCTDRGHTHAFGSTEEKAIRRNHSSCRLRGDQWRFSARPSSGPSANLGTSEISRAQVRDCQIRTSSAIPEISGGSVLDELRS